jgi:PAS domain S-box-containing protein
MQRSVTQQPSTHPLWFRYSTAVVLPALSVALTLLWNASLLSDTTSTRFIFGALAVAGTAWVGGFGPGLLSAVFFVGTATCFVPHPHFAHAFGPSECVTAIVFALLSLFISAICHHKRIVQQTLLKITDSMPAGIAYLDRNLCYRFANAAYEHRFGVKQEQIYGLHISQIIGQSNFEKTRAAMERALAGESGHTEAEVTDKNGQLLSLDAELIPADRVKNVIPGIFVLSMDVTARKRVEVELRSHQQKLAALNENLEIEIAERMAQLKKKEEELYQARKLEAIGLLAGGVAHDFNNLMTGIIGISEGLMESLPTGDTRRDEVKQILAASQRTSELTRQLLALGRRQIANPQIIDLNAAIKGVSKMLRRFMQEDTYLELRLGPPIWIRLDISQLHQILINLVANARDAMPGGGTLTLETTSIDDNVVLNVKDNGTGMSEEVRSHLFEPFFTTKGRHKGAGLGLASVYGIVKQNAGDIDVISQPGLGTTFRITFPKAVPQSATMIEILSEPPAGSEEKPLFEIDCKVPTLS